MILYINACVRQDSRTERLAEALLKQMADDIQQVRLEDITFEVTDQAFIDKREQLIEEGAFDHEMFALARQFASADQIVIAAPYWDLSFPAALKQYIENVTVNGITFVYTPEGIPSGLCKAQKLYYVTTVGGDYAPDEYGYGYIQAIAGGYYGITDTKLIKATGLDIIGADVEEILTQCIEREINA